MRSLVDNFDAFRLLTFHLVDTPQFGGRGRPTCFSENCRHLQEMVSLFSVIFVFYIVFYICLIVVVSHSFVDIMFGGMGFSIFTEHVEGGRQSRVFLRKLVASSSQVSLFSVIFVFYIVFYLYSTFVFVRKTNSSTTD